MHRIKRAPALRADRLRAPPSLLVVARPLITLSAEADHSPLSARLPASLSCLRSADCRAETGSPPPLWPASQTTRAACLLVVFQTSDRRSSPSGFPSKVSRRPPAQSRPRGFPRVSVRTPTFGVPKCRSRCSLGLASLCCLQRGWVCRPFRVQSCSLCPMPLWGSSGATSMCLRSHAAGRDPLGF